MAKGFETFKQTGKIDGRKFYYMKGVEGIVSSRINTGMSNRVKNSAEYANTRLNNAEFGAAGNMAGTIVRALTQRWRCVTIPFATAKLLPSIKKALGLDTTHDWGQRTLEGTGWQDSIRAEINKLSKVSYDEEIGLFLYPTFDGSNLAGSISGTMLQKDFLESKGISGVQMDMHLVIVDAPEYNNDIKGYKPAVVIEGTTMSEDLPLVITTPKTFSVESSSVVLDATKHLAGILYVFKPYREVNGEKYFAQEYCCHKYVAVDDIRA